MDAQTVVAVSGDLDNEIITTSDLVRELTESGAVREVAEKHGVDFRFAGRDEERRKSFADLQYGAIVAMGIIYLVLAWVFASYSVPFAVMLVIPFGFVGAMLGHFLMGFPITILSLMGLLGLSGILVNDSIILVARARERHDDGETMEDASVNASCDRLRAVLLTSLTTIGGLAPLLAEKELAGAVPAAHGDYAGFRAWRGDGFRPVPRAGLSGHRARYIRRVVRWFYMDFLLARDRPAPAE